MRKLARRILEAHGYVVTEARNGRVTDRLRPSPGQQGA
jgi:CheY-like chemotaxis protein